MKALAALLEDLRDRRLIVGVSWATDIDTSDYGLTRSRTFRVSFTRVRGAVFVEMTAEDAESMAEAVRDLVEPRP